MRFLGPHSAGEGPHLVPISLKIGSPSGPHFEKSGSPWHVATVRVVYKQSLHCSAYVNGLIRNEPFVVDIYQNPTGCPLPSKCKVKMSNHHHLPGVCRQGLQPLVPANSKFLGSLYEEGILQIYLYTVI